MIEINSSPHKMGHDIFLRDIDHFMPLLQELKDFEVNIMYNEFDKKIKIHIKEYPDDLDFNFEVLSENEDIFSIENDPFYTLISTFKIDYRSKEDIINRFKESWTFIFNLTTERVLKDSIMLTRGLYFERSLFFSELNDDDICIVVEYIDGENSDYKNKIMEYLINEVSARNINNIISWNFLNKKYTSLSTNYSKYIDHLKNTIKNFDTKNLMIVFELLFKNQYLIPKDHYDTLLKEVEKYIDIDLDIR